MTEFVRPGLDHPPGATWAEDGTNFAVFSEHADQVELVLFEEGEEPSRVIALEERNHFMWHGWVPDVQPGTRYGFRAHGPYDPDNGHRFNPAKLLTDPYAKAIDGELVWRDEVYPYDLHDPDDDLQIDSRQDHTFKPKSVVVDTRFDWGDDSRLDTPLLESVIYELHVKGATALHPDVPEADRGTYRGLAHPAVIEHLQSIGITAVELLPVHAFVDDHFLVRQKLRNYWGYQTLGFFAPEGRYAASGTRGEQVSEFKEMVRAFHNAGIEVLLDVVYNHTCEGNHLGPMLSLRGLDNAAYYRLLPDRSRYYMDFTGTGNTLNVPHPQVLKLITDSLRYWVEEMHVDGFRFDLASALARERYEVDPHGGFFDAIHQDPVLSNVKLIAEPWDVGEGGYQVGGFPVIWSEWNDRFRDGVRTFWNTGGVSNADIGYRLTGSSDLYRDAGRGPVASINMICAHDGFTLRDLVSYNHKHNEANGEVGQGGNDHNISANYGAEGETDDPAIRALRRRQTRNMLATLFLAQGVPMLLGGDELGRTQRGNNNAYCQDNEISWVNWDVSDEDQPLLAFVSLLASIRRDQPILRRRRFFQGQPMTPDGFKDLSWLKSDGSEFSHDDWHRTDIPALGLHMPGNTIDEKDMEGHTITGSNLLLILNRGETDVTFRLPLVDRDDLGDSWNLIMTTDSEDGDGEGSFPERTEVMVPGRTVMLFEAPMQ